MTELLQIKRALVSVSDKTGLVEFAHALHRWNVDIISTGGTLKTLRDAGIPATSVSEVTGFPEILDGRVKTLHPKIHAGLLAIPTLSSHQTQLDELGIQSIDLVVINLYPFEKIVAQDTVSLDEAIEQIDIGGATMLRAAAKNFRYKLAVSDPSQYQTMMSELEKHNGSVSEKTRFTLAKEAFLHIARYDRVISEYFVHLNGHEPAQELPEIFSLSLPKMQTLRYGENPHQQAALYGGFNKYFRQLHGKELSYNNLVDIQAAAELIEEFTEPTAVLVKHTNPCGVGSDKMLSEAYGKALATDPKSAFGGIVCVNKPLDLATAQRIDKIFTEVVIAPEFPEEVLALFRKKKDRRLISQHMALRSERRLLLKRVAGGVLLQTPDDITVEEQQLRTVTRRAPTEEERAAMLFAWRVAKHVKSNAIVYARADRTVGIGAGQMSRVDSSRLAAQKAQDAGLDLRGTAVASDAFFPFADGLLETVKAGATAVIQPGGSVRDAEVNKAADEHNIAMVFTGIRHFKH